MTGAKTRGQKKRANGVDLGQWERVSGAGEGRNDKLLGGVFKGRAMLGYIWIVFVPR